MLLHNHRVSYFDIEGYRPQWLQGVPAMVQAHGERLDGLRGRILSGAWLIWDLDEDEWFADGPVLFDFDGEQVEINHRRTDDLSITWNTVDPVGRATWSCGDNDPDDYTFHLGWKCDACPELAALQGQRLRAAELLEWTGDDMANGSVAPSFVFADGQVTIHNALDENGLEFDPRSPHYRVHALRGGPR